MEIHTKLFIIHFLCSVVIFLLFLSATVSDYWSVSEFEFFGIFKNCHVVNSCTSGRQVSAVYRMIQFFQVITCISTISSVVYCFISIILRKYVQMKVHWLSMFYIIEFICGCCSLFMYVFLVHKKLLVLNLKFGWATYVLIGATVLSLFGSLFSFILYRQQKKANIIKEMETKELRYQYKR